MYPAIITHKISHGCSNILILLDEAVSDATKLDQAGKAMPGWVVQTRAIYARRRRR